MSFCPTILKIQRYGEKKFIFKIVDFLIKYSDPETLLLIECKTIPDRNDLIQLQDYAKLIQMTSFFNIENLPFYVGIYSDWDEETGDNYLTEKGFESLFLDTLHTKEKYPHILKIKAIYEDWLDELFESKS